MLSKYLTLSAIPQTSPSGARYQNITTSGTGQTQSRITCNGHGHSLLHLFYQANILLSIYLVLSMILNILTMVLNTVEKVFIPYTILMVKISKKK